MLTMTPVTLAAMFHMVLGCPRISRSRHSLQRAPRGDGQSCCSLAVIFIMPSEYCGASGTAALGPSRLAEGVLKLVFARSTRQRVAVRHEPSSQALRQRPHKIAD